MLLAGIVSPLLGLRFTVNRQPRALPWAGIASPRWG